MPRLELTDAEADALVIALDDVLSELSYEISSTDRQDLREALKRRREALQNVLRGLKAEQSA